MENSVFCLLLCLHCLFLQASSVAEKPLDEQIGILEENLYQAFDWKCNSHSECTVLDSSCIDNSCRCTEGYIFNANMTSCVKVATTYGDECGEAIQCSKYLLSGASCENNICVCGRGYYYMHGRCNKYSGLFEKCEKNDDCYVNADFEATSCVNQICQCSPGFYQREYRTCRPEGRAIGEECTVDNDCTFSETARCDSDFKCAENTINDNNEDNDPFNFLSNFEVNRQTYAGDIDVRVDKSCSVDDDCKILGNAVCGTSGKCTCARAHFLSETGDKCIPELGEPCENEEPIYIDYSICRDGRWGCENRRVANKNNRKCEKVTRKYNSSCLVDESCYIFGPDATCLKKKCVCNENSRYLEDELFCWVKRGVGESCHNDIDCYVEGLDAELSCTESICSCPNGTRLNSDGTQCVETSAGIGSNCERDLDCATENSICVNDTCACVDNYYLLDDKCVAGINGSCADNNCTPEHSMCVSNVCTCQNDYVAASISSCLRTVSYGKPCEQDIQCSTVLPNTVCSSGNTAEMNLPMDASDKVYEKACVCADGYYYKSNKCSRKRVLGESCAYLDECYVVYNPNVAVCKNGQCGCDWGYSQESETECVSSSKTLRDLPGGAATTVSGGILTTVLLLILNFLSLI